MAGKKRGRSSYPFHILYGPAPKEGERRVYQVISAADEACNSTQTAESLINRLLEEGRVTLSEGDHMVVAQITRVKALKPIRSVEQVDEDPSQAFGGDGTGVSLETDDEEEPETEEIAKPAPEKASKADKKPAPKPEKAPEATQDADDDDDIPDEVQDPFSDQDAPEGDLVDEGEDEDDSEGEDAEEEEPKKASGSDDPLDDIF